MDLGKLTAQLAAAAPIAGVATGDPADRMTWRIDFMPEATALQRATALAMLAAFNPAAADLCDQVTVLRDARLAAGYTDATTGKTWECDADSIGKWTAIGSSAGLAIVMAIEPPPRFVLIPADNTTIALAPADAFALFSGRVMPWVSATFIFARAMKNAILAGNAPADITRGWP